MFIAQPAETEPCLDEAFTGSAGSESPSARLAGDVEATTIATAVAAAEAALEVVDANSGSEELDASIDNTMMAQLAFATEAVAVVATASGTAELA